jgi:hypothetical protein
MHPRALRLAFPLFLVVGASVELGCGSSGDAGAGAGGSGPAGGGNGGGGAHHPGAGGSGGTGTGGGGAGGPTAICAEPDPGPLAPTYYVDFASGDDGANGKSKTAAWKHAPGDAAATGQAAAAKLVPGDVVLFKGGVAYQGSIDIPASGTTDKPLVYDGNSRGTWGSGRALIDGEEKRALGMSLNGKSSVLIDSFDLAHFDKSQSSTAIAIDGGDHDEVRHCHGSDIYYPKNPGGTSWESQSGNGVTVNNSPRTRVHHNVMRDIGNAGFSFSAESGMVIDGGEVSCNEVTNMNWGVAVALGNSTPGTKITNVKIVGNYIHDFDQYYVSSVWHRDGIFVFARPDTDQATIENLELSYNYFEDNSSAFGSTAWIYIEYVCKGFNIHHNVLNASRSYYGLRVLGDGFQVEGNHVIANNVIDNDNGMGDGMHLQESSGIHLLNNIFYDTGNAYDVATSSMDGFEADYDLFFRTDGQSTYVILNAGPAEAPDGDSEDLAGLKAKTAFEKHGLYGDPMFSVDPKMIDSDATGFAPKAGSPAVDHGTLAGYSKDYSGAKIPQGAGPDIGAFER